MLKRLGRPFTAVRYPIIPRVSFSSSRFLQSDEEKFTPWYVSEARKTLEPQNDVERIVLPALPSNSPAELEALVRYALDDMGLKDVVVIDKRSEEQLSGALGPSIIVLGTGASSRHLGTASEMLLTHLKHEYKVNAGSEGILTSNFLKLQNRRSKRKQQRQRMATTSNGNLSRVGSWVAIDTKLKNIYVHLMTEERRKGLDLEHLSEYIEEFDKIESVQSSNVFVDPVTPLRKKFTREYSTMPANREELALQNLNLERRDDMTEASREVVDFVSYFPKIPTREDWKIRLQFFALITQTSPSFPIKRLVSEARKQQVDGFPLDNHDIEIVLSGICYSGLSQFQNLSRDDEAMIGWSELCEIKASHIAEFYEFAMLPQNKTLLGNPRLVTLLYRTFTSMCADSTTPAAALQSAEPQHLDAFYDLRRLTPIRYILESSGELKNFQTVSLLLTSLCNANLMSPFWKVVDGMLLSTEDKESIRQLLELAVCLAIKTGNEETIRHTISVFLPQKIIANNIELTPTLANATRLGLKSINASNSLEFKSLTDVLDKFEKSTKTIES